MSQNTNIHQQHQKSNPDFQNNNSKIISGKKISQEIYKEIQTVVNTLETKPHLSVIIVGNRKDSLTYVNMKTKMCQKLGYTSELIKYDEDVEEETLINKIIVLNENNSVSGILVQLPLPKHINEDKVLEYVDLKKDVDGFHFTNIGRLTLNKQPKFVACTPKGCLELLKRSGIELEGKNVVVLGRSRIVGIPMSLLLLHENCTVTICHSRTKNVKEITSKADILIAACGKTQMVKKDWIKQGCIIIDVGINSIDDSTKKRGYRLVGDVDYNDVFDKCGMITPVPGGVGPMTICMLMKNTLDSFLSY